MYHYGKIVQVNSCLESKLLVITSLDGGSGDKTSKIASIGGVGSARMHLLPLFRAASALDLKPRVLSLDVDHPSILNNLGSPDLCIIGKINHFDDSRVEGFAMATLAAVARLKALNIETNLLYCDHLAPLSCVRGSLYRDLLAISDKIIVPCQAMADRAKQFLPSSTPVTVIEDPWQVRLQGYKPPEKGLPIRLGWFGNANNSIFLCEKLEELMRNIACAPSIELVVLSNAMGLEKVESAFRHLSPFAIKPWKLELIQWDDSLQPTQLETILGSVHVVCLPSNPNSPIKGGVSHNRLVDAVRSGTIVVASEMDSYKELRQLALLGSDHAAMINKLVPQYNRLALKYEGLRQNLLKRFSPDLNHFQWVSLLRQSSMQNKKR